MHMHTNTPAIFANDNIGRADCLRGNVYMMGDWMGRSK